MSSGCRWTNGSARRCSGSTASTSAVDADWLARGLLLPLLDGLDEVAETHRPACADAINAFRKDHGAVGLVVACRDAEYRELPPLALLAAIRLLPLEPGDIARYLDRAGQSLTGLRQAIAADPGLAALARTPLMLTMMGLVYWDQPAGQIIAASAVPAGTGAGQARREALFDAYLDHAFRRKDYLPDRGYTEAQTRRWLTRLAVEQERRGRTLFRIEDLQPDWGVGGCWG